MPYYPTTPYPSTQSTAVDVLSNYFSTLYPMLADITLKIFTAFVIFVLGWLVAIFVKLAVEFILGKIRLREGLEKIGLGKYFENFTWEESMDRVLAEISFWVVFAVFLMTAFQVLGLQVINSFMSSVVSYVPKAVVGGFVLLFGFIFGELARKSISGFFKGLEKKSANAASSLVKWAIIVLAFLAALNQWGVAPDVMNTLVLGLVLFLALAGGLAFGLGGQETAREILENIRRGLK